MLHNKDIRGITAYASMTLLPNKKWKGLFENPIPLLKNQRNRLKVLQVICGAEMVWAMLRVKNLKRFYQNPIYPHDLLIPCKDSSNIHSQNPR